METVEIVLAQINSTVTNYYREKREGIPVKGYPPFLQCLWMAASFSQAAGKAWWIGDLENRDGRGGGI